MAKTKQTKVIKETLRLRRLGIDTYRENVAYLHRDCEIYWAEGFQALSKVEICADGRRILAVLNVADDDKIQPDPVPWCVRRSAAPPQQQTPCRGDAS